MRSVVTRKYFYLIFSSNILNHYWQTYNDLKQIFNSLLSQFFIGAQEFSKSFLQNNHRNIVDLRHIKIVIVVRIGWNLVIYYYFCRLVMRSPEGQVQQNQAFFGQSLKFKNIVHKLWYCCYPMKESIELRRLSISLCTLREQWLQKLDVTLVQYVINTFPNQITAITFHQIYSNNSLSFSDWKVYILEAEIILTQVAQDIRKSRGVLEKFIELYELKVIILSVDCVQRDFELIFQKNTALSTTSLVPHLIIKLQTHIKQVEMNHKTKIDFSVPKESFRESIQEERKSKIYFRSPVTSRVQSKQHILKYDINTLLSLFNEMELHGSGEVTRKGAKKILDLIGLYNQENRLKSDKYSFDQLLSIIGQIQVPSEPSVYVLSFVRILASYRDKCLQNEQQGLEEAKEVQEKIKNIAENQIERQKLRIKQQHNKIYEEMQVSQEKQFRSFQDEWKNYLSQFREEASRRLQETKHSKKSKLVEQQVKFLNKARKNTVITSPRLRQLIEKKKWLVHQKKFEEAIAINQQILKQKSKIVQYKQEQTDSLLTKKLQKLTKHTNRYIGVVQKNLQVNLNRLVSKKRQGQSIMKIRMKNLREQANRKLNDHFLNQLSRLRSSFYLASNP